MLSLPACAAADTSGDCFECAASSLLLGACLPGLYGFNLTVTNSQGYTSPSIVLQVQIYERVSLCVPLEVLVFCSNIIKPLTDLMHWRLEFANT